MKFKMKQKVKILSSRKSDGKYNCGTIIGMEMMQTEYCLYIPEKDILKTYNGERYKVIYCDCVTNRYSVEWFYVKNLEKL